MEQEQAGQKTAQLVGYICDSLAAEGIEPGTPEAAAWLAEHGTGDPEFWSGAAANAARAEAAAAQEPAADSGVPESRVPVTRTVALVVRAPNEQVAQETALDLARDWAPEQADGGDQGMVHADSATIAGSGLSSESWTHWRVSSRPHLLIFMAVAGDETWPHSGRPIGDNQHRQG